ncbi:MAG: hypothetical protein HC840_17090 [Leptolyngbyaceae cyanobacterium RM2_2_4]|nr:hypothetical protein [Leptolyngbyaceae cyanobacterium SM1_4_3]NJN92523.1 hypothetical protein [Leptolyngbyaceae cyanobacterium SL_5_14]NJO50872.1 hypothetical protein [Leptolyngbyaceae cyanobacterium RM2_2_4]
MRQVLFVIAGCLAYLTFKSFADASMWVATSDPSLGGLLASSPLEAFVNQADFGSSPAPASDLLSFVMYEADPVESSANLRGWMRLLNLSEPNSPENTLAHIVACLFTRDLGVSGNLEAAVDRWLTEQGQENKSALLPFDMSSPWVNTLSLAEVEESPEGDRITYHLQGTMRTSVPNEFFPIELSIEIVNDGEGGWLADDFEVSPEGEFVMGNG